MGLYQRLNSRMDGMAAEGILGLLAAVMGAVLYFCPAVAVSTLCMVSCVGMIVAGIVCITLFFALKWYHNAENYSFSLGILFILLGIVGLVRLEEMAGSVSFFMGVVTLILGVLILQHTIQLRVAQGRLWVLVLIFTLAVVISSVIVLVNFRAVLDAVAGFGYLVLMLAGIVTLASLLITWLTLRRVPAREESGEE